MEPPFDPTLLSLVRAALAGDEQALERLLVPVHVHVSRYLYAWLDRSGDDVVQDLAQECVLRVMRALGECQATTDAGFLAWCRTVAKNAGLDRFRAEKRERESQAAIQVLSAGTGHWQQDENAHTPAMRTLLQALAEALGHESESAHEVLWHRLVQGDTWEAAAKGLHVSPAGSKRRYQRTLRRLDRRVRCTLAAQRPAERERLSGFLEGGRKWRPPAGSGEKVRSCASRAPVQLCPLRCLSPAQTPVMVPNSPAGPAQSQIPVIRDLVQRRVEETGLRKVARQVGMSPSGLSKFLDGTAPYQKSIRKLQAWYKRERATGERPADVEATAAALRVLARLVPAAGRDPFVDCTLEILTRLLPAGAQLPTLLAPYGEFIRAPD